MSLSIHFRTVTNALDRIIVSGDFILSDLSLPIIRHARSCSALDLMPDGLGSGYHRFESSLVLEMWRLSLDVSHSIFCIIFHLFQASFAQNRVNYVLAVSSMRKNCYCKYLVVSFH